MKCLKCGYAVSDEDSFCGKCGNDLTEAKMNEKRLEQEEAKRQEEENLKKEIKDYAYNLIIDCEGNKFKAIKELKEKYNIENDLASEYINEAYDKINKNDNSTVEEVQNDNNSIESIIKKNNYQTTQSIQEVKKIYGYDLASAKRVVDDTLKKMKSTNEYINPKGIKKAIIVSQNSRKKATSAIGRGLIGGALLGPVGLLAGVSAKSKNTTTFQIIYNSGKQETITVNNNSWLFKEYCKYLDD